MEDYYNFLKKKGRVVSDEEREGLQAKADSIGELRDSLAEEQLGRAMEAKSQDPASAIREGELGRAMEAKKELGQNYDWQHLNEKQWSPSGEEDGFFEDYRRPRYDQEGRARELYPASSYEKIHDKIFMDPEQLENLKRKFRKSEFGKDYPQQSTMETLTRPMLGTYSRELEKRGKMSALGKDELNRLQNLEDEYSRIKMEKGQDEADKFWEKNSTEVDKVNMLERGMAMPNPKASPLYLRQQEKKHQERVKKRAASTNEQQAEDDKKYSDWMKSFKKLY